ncbi:MAG: beta propeller repeat protein [Streptosporangiaceae bacterium]
MTLAYFRHGVGLVGIAPLGGGWQGYRPSTLWLATPSGHWHNVTPPGVLRHQIRGAYPVFEAASFVNAATGWVTTWDPATTAVTMYATRDGGASWIVVGHGEHSENAGATDLIQVISPQDAFSETIEPTAPGMRLQATTNGGHSWHTIYSGPAPRQPGSPLTGPFEMPMVFISPSYGIAASGIPPVSPISPAGGPDIFISRDGGPRWTRESPPLAASRARCTASGGYPPPCVFGLPVFASPTRAVLPSEVVSGTSVAVGFDTTANGGAAWTLLSVLRVPLHTHASAARYPLVSIPSVGTWWILAAAQRGVTVWITSNRGRSWSSATDPAVPGIPAELQATSVNNAWLTTVVRTPAGDSEELFATTDAGRSWHRVHPG